MVLPDPPKVGDMLVTGDRGGDSNAFSPVAPTRECCTVCEDEMVDPLTGAVAVSLARG